jgi:predicted ATP-grasp superfamily ATP-dependent carboligase
MRIGAFQVNEPLPELSEPHAFAMLRPWINAGDVGALTLSWLEKYTQAKPLAELARPGNFFDFTRYRPMFYESHGERRVQIPNSYITFGRRAGGRDFLFLHLLEPHMFGEIYVDSVVKILKKFGTKRYCLLGSMYNFVPHTRRPLVSGGTSTDELKQKLEQAGVSASTYQGPITICTLISEKAAEWGVENMTMIVSLPQYTQLDEDFMGVVRLQEIISDLYDIPVPEESINRAKQQREQISAAVAGNPQVQEIVEQLEETYDARMSEREAKREPPPLSPEVEKFLREMERRFRRE